jgi:hypothetical protein
LLHQKDERIGKIYSEGREACSVSPQFGSNVGVIDQHYKTISRLFLSENALVEDSGQNPHRAIKIDPTKFRKNILKIAKIS